MSRFYPYREPDPAEYDSEDEYQQAHDLWEQEVDDYIDTYNELNQINRDL